MKKKTVTRWMVTTHHPGHSITDDQGIVIPDWIVWGGGAEDWLERYTYASRDSAKAQGKKISHATTFGVFSIRFPAELFP